MAADRAKTMHSTIPINCLTENGLSGIRQASAADSKANGSDLLENLIHPALKDANALFLDRLDAISIAQLFETYEQRSSGQSLMETVNFTI